MQSSTGIFELISWGQHYSIVMFGGLADTLRTRRIGMRMTLSYLGAEMDIADGKQTLKEFLVTLLTKKGIR